MPGFRGYLFLAAGGVVGVVSRYQIGILFAKYYPSDFPWATLAINLLGSFALGFLMRYFLHSAASLELRLALATGFCGGFTTLSTFSYEFIKLLIDKQTTFAALYFLSTISLAPLMCYAGFTLAILAL